MNPSQTIKELSKAWSYTGSGDYELSYPKLWESYLTSLASNKSESLSLLIRHPINLHCCEALKILGDETVITALIVTKAENPTTPSDRYDALHHAAENALKAIMLRGAKPNISEIAQLLINNDFRVRCEAASFLAKYAKQYINDDVPIQIHRALESKKEFEDYRERNSLNYHKMLGVCHFYEYAQNLSRFILVNQNDPQKEYDVLWQGMWRTSPNHEFMVAQLPDNSANLLKLNSTKFMQDVSSLAINPEISDSRRERAWKICARLKNEEVTLRLVEALYNPKIKTPRRFLERFLLQIPLLDYPSVQNLLQERVCSENKTFQIYTIDLLWRSVPPYLVTPVKQSLLEFFYNAQNCPNLQEEIRKYLNDAVIGLIEGTPHPSFQHTEEIDRFYR